MVQKLKEGILWRCGLTAVASGYKTQATLAQSQDPCGSGMLGITVGNKTSGHIPLVRPPFPECKSDCLWHPKNVLTDLYPVSNSLLHFMVGAVAIAAELTLFPSFQDSSAFCRGLYTGTIQKSRFCCYWFYLFACSENVGEIESRVLA